jgi:hypothetical protein
LSCLFEASTTCIMLCSLYFKAPMAIRGATKFISTLTLFQSELTNHASFCYVNSSHLLEDLVLSNKGTVDGINDGLALKGRGTFKITIRDDNVRRHNIIPKSLYVPGMKKCLLSPQHWAKTAADKMTWMENFDDCCILFWNGGQKTIPFSTLTNVPPVVAAAAVCVTALASSLESLVFSTLYMFGASWTSPCWPVVFRKLVATSHCTYALCTNAFIMGHFLFGTASQSSNLHIRKIPDLRRRCIMLDTNCVCVYRFSATITTSWHCSILWKSILGALVGKKSAVNNLLLFHNIVGISLPYDNFNCARMSWTLILGFHPSKLGLLETLKWPRTSSLSIWKHAWLMFTYERKKILAFSQTWSAILIIWTVANCWYTGRLPGAGGITKAATFIRV